MNTDEKQLISRFLMHSAWADNLGDIRNHEHLLWQSMGISPEEYDEVGGENGFDSRLTTKALAKLHPDLGFDLEWVNESEDEWPPS